MTWALPSQMAESFLRKSSSRNVTAALLLTAPPHSVPSISQTEFWGKGITSITSKLFRADSSFI